MRLSRNGAEIVLPKGMILQQARELNVKAQEYDGIKEIGENGDIIITDEAYATFKEMMGVDCRVITSEDSYEQGMELKKQFHEFVRKHGVNV